MIPFLTAAVLPAPVMPVLFLAGLLLIWFAMRKTGDPEQICTALLAACVAVTFCFAAWLYRGTLTGRAIGAIKLVFQVLQGDSDELLCMTAARAQLLPLARTICIVTPTMTAGTVLVFLLRRLPRPVLPPLKCHIFSALDEHTLLLAKSIAGQEHAHFIFLRTRREAVSADLLPELKELRCQCWPYTEADLVRRHLSLRLRPLCFYFLTENSEDNLQQMDDFLSQAKAGSLFRLPGSRELFLLSEGTSSPMLIDNLRGKYADLPGTELRLLDRYRAMSSYLLKNASLYEARRSGDVRVLMLGMGRVGQSILRTALSMGAMPGRDTSFHLFDLKADQILDTMKQQYPDLTVGHTVTAFPLDAESAKLREHLDAHPFDYLVVALGDDERNLRTASLLYRFYRRKYWNGDLKELPRICVNLEDAVKRRSSMEIYPDRSRSPWEPGFTVFGTDEETFSTDVLLPRGTWLAARKLHTLLSGQAPKANWCEYERRSSCAAVDHAPVYVAAVRPSWEYGSNEAEYLTRLQPHLSDLIDVEHKRWMAYVRSEGMTLADEQTWKQYVPHLKTHVDIRGQLSPCLVPAGELDKLYEKLRPYMKPDRLHSFRQGDELVVRNADLLSLIAQSNDPDIELRPLPNDP